MLLSKTNRCLPALHTMRRYSAGSVPVMPECPFTPEKYEGITYERVMEIRAKHVTPTMQPAYAKHLLLTEGKMQWLWDDQGRRYLDLFAGIATVGVGHCHSKLNEALRSQLGKLWHTTQMYLNGPCYEYAEKITSTLPGNLKVCFFTNSGSEANDLAMALAREHTGAFDLISFRNAYHGDSPYTLGLTAHRTWKHSYATGFGIHHLVNPDPYKGIWGGAHCRDSHVQPDRQCACAEGECLASDKYIEQLQELLKTSVGKKVAGIFAEPIQGVGGVVQFPKGFLKKAFEIVRANGGVCVADEVQTGFGRTGSHMWGFQSHDVMPDIVTMAKGIGNGFPMSAVVTTPEIVKSFFGPKHLNTFAGNPLACAVASKVLDVIDEDKIQERCVDLGRYFILELAKLRDEFEVVGDVRGKGLMLGVEMVESKESRDPLNGDDMITIWEDMKEMGVLVGRGGLHMNTFRIKPPMCINKEDVDFGVAVMRQALANFTRKKSSS